jgi:penicillin-binding protein 1A
MDFGLQDEQIPRNYTIALGTPQVLPIQMATGYATFANGGYRIQPHFINRIEDAYGKVIYENNLNMHVFQCINETETPYDDDNQTPDDEVIEVTNQDADRSNKQASQTCNNQQ